MGEVDRSGKIRQCTSLVLLLCCGLFVQHVGAQTGQLPVGLQTVLELAGAQNLTIQRLKIEQKKALASVDQAKAWMLPDLYAGAAIDQRWGAAMNSDGRFFTEVENKNFWGGLGVDAHWDIGTGVYQLQAAKLRAQATLALTQAERNKQLLKVIDVYYDYLNAEMVQDSYGRLLGISDTITRQLRVQADAGLRYRSEFLLAQSNLSHLRVEILGAKLNSRKAMVDLLGLLNLPLDQDYYMSDTVLTPLHFVSSQSLSSDSAHTSRPEYEAAQLLLKAYEREKKSVTTGLLFPELNVGAFTSQFGDVFSPLYNTNAFNASLMWRIPFSHFAFGGDKKFAQAEVSYQENMLRSIALDIDKDIKLARETLEISEAQMGLAGEAVNATSEAWTQAVERQRKGLVVPLEMLQIQDLFLRARLDYFKAVSNYNSAQFKLWVALGNDL